MTPLRELLRATRMTLVLWVLTAVLYPLVILVVGQVAFPAQANGSLIQNQAGQVIGSALIGQPFTGDRYFQSRPSTIDYSTGENAAPTGLSGASNLAPTNPDLLKRVQTQIAELQKADIQPTADLVYTSGSGLDPHITPTAALAQVDRIAQSRTIDPKSIEKLVNQYTDHRLIGTFGESGVNVLKLNLALDQLQNS